MGKEQVAKDIYAAAHLTGRFLLRSGQISNEYFDKFLFEADPKLLGDVAKEMAPLIPPGTQVLAGLEMGGIPVATALALESGIPAAFVRKRAKEYGTCKLAEGADISGKRVCIVEDIVTTGGQILESATQLRQRGAIVENVLCVILRNAEAVDILEAGSLNLTFAFTMDYIKSVV